MTLNKLIASCPCGGLVAVVNMFVTDSKCLLTTGMCMVCNETIKTAWPLTELYKNCPKPEPDPLRKPEPKPVRPPLLAPPSDTEFLHSLGISEGAPE